MGENNGTRVSPNGEPEIAEIEPVEQINDPSHPDGMGEQSPVVASDSAPVDRGTLLIPRSFLEVCETIKKKFWHHPGSHSLGRSNGNYSGQQLEQHSVIVFFVGVA